MRAGFEHVGEEALERYAIGTLLEPELEAFEEHLLVCPECQRRLAEMDEYLRTVRAAASALRAEKSAWSRLSLTFIPLLFQRPTVAWVAASVALVVLLIPIVSLLNRPSAVVPPVAVLLQAIRGPGLAAETSAPRNRTLILQADLSGLRPQFPCELEVVRGSGQRVLRSGTTGDHEWQETQVPAGLDAGQYWVRLYDSSSTEVPLREYSLRVE